MIRYGLDFGTTNSSISLLADGSPKLLNIDNLAPDPSVVRSALYFYPRKFVISKDVARMQLQSQTFFANQVSYEGEMKTSIGATAVSTYLEDNKHRKPGIKRKIYTGKRIHIAWTVDGVVKTEEVPEFYEDTDYGTGRIFHAMKTALKSSFYKGTSIFGQYFSLENMIGFFLADMKRKADDLAGEKITAVTCGRPVSFSIDKDKDKAAQDRLEDALKNAGFKDIRFEYEPIGAAKYFLYKYPKEHQKIFVFDFGGGTLDTTIVEKTGNSFDVLATDGVYIGGDLINSDILYHKLGPYFGTDVTWGDNQLKLPASITDSLRSWYSIPNLNNTEDLFFLNDKVRYKISDSAAIDRLVYLVKMNLGFEIYEAIENAKKVLSNQESAVISYKDGPIDINMTITREEFENLISLRIKEIEGVVFRTLKNAKLEPGSIDQVVATGGSSYIPMVQNMLGNIFGKEKVQIFDTFTSIAAGLAL